jgi:anti-sigma28 factor (negative regulator of flagellin synthesis)
MKVDKTKEVGGVDRAPPSTERLPVRPRTDRVSIEEARQAEEVIKTVRGHADTGRAARLASIESAIRNGTYRPDPGRLAEQLLSQAEVDARLRALFQG